MTRKAAPRQEAGHTHFLSILAVSDSTAIKVLAERVLDATGPVRVIRNRTGLVMLPCRDTVDGTVFHLGEVLVAEAHINLTDYGAEGYGACIGRDLEHAMAIAILDAAASCTLCEAEIDSFVAEQTALVSGAENLARRKVEATRVELETF